MPSERELIDAVRAQVERLARAGADAEFWYERRVEELAASFEAVLAQQRAEWGDVFADLRERHGPAALAAWDEAEWNSWTPRLDQPVPPAIRIGELSEPSTWG